MPLQLNEARAKKKPITFYIFFTKRHIDAENVAICLLALRGQAGSGVFEKTVWGAIE